MSEEQSPEAAPAPEFSKEELKQALKAFKKRLKLTRQDDESRIGGGAFSSGKRSGIVGIVPPTGFPEGIWQALVEKGRLRRIPGTKRRPRYEVVRQG